ncbi:MAG TPA: hypothetical protein VD757_01140 [Candidatus Nitrosocosmicus sp.]|nr:hypothetical protein [Candidatus Nitrosocosmicus sp.]
MADKNIRMKKKKADGTYDIYYPETKAANVKTAGGSNLEAHLADNVQGTNPGQTAIPHGLPKYKVATVSPTVNDDSSAGYSVGSKWINAVTGVEYTCFDTTVGAAVWKGGSNTAETFAITSTADATSTIDAPLKSAGGLAIAKKSYFGDSIQVNNGPVKSKTQISSIANNATFDIPVMNDGGCLLFVHHSQTGNGVNFTSKAYIVVGRYTQGYTITELSSKTGTAPRSFTLAQNGLNAELRLTNTSGGTCNLSYGMYQMN